MRVEVRSVQLEQADLSPIHKGWGMTPYLMWLPLFWLAAMVIVSSFIIGFFGEVSLPMSVGLPLIAITAVGYILTSNLAAHLLQKAQLDSPSTRPTDWDISDRGFATTVGEAHSFLPWSHIRGVQEEKSRFVFLHQIMHNPVLPKRYMTSEQIEDLRALTRSHSRLF